MKIGTFSIVVGGTGCDANCPFCVSKMTGRGDARIKESLGTATKRVRGELLSRLGM
jgi:organic radical activating enzyme